jgi:hypothetical protein
LELRIDAIIGWKDICSHGLFDVLLHCKVDDQEVKVSDEVSNVSVSVVSKESKNDSVDANELIENVILVQGKQESSEKNFNLGENILAITKKQFKSNLLWKSPCAVRKKLDDEMYEVEHLESKEVFNRHKSAMWKLKCVKDEDSSSEEAHEEEVEVLSIQRRKLKGVRKKNRNHWLFQVKFKDKSVSWLPYQVVRDLPVFGEYLRKHIDFAKLLNLKVSL